MAMTITPIDILYTQLDTANNTNNPFINCHQLLYQEINEHNNINFLFLFKKKILMIKRMLLFEIYCVELVYMPLSAISDEWHKLNCDLYLQKI